MNLRRLPRLCFMLLLVLGVSLPCLGENVAHLGLPWYSLDLPAGFVKSMGPTVSGGTLKTSNYAWKKAPVTVRAELTSFPHTVEEKYASVMAQVRSIQGSQRSVANLQGDKDCPGGLSMVRYWFAYNDKWEYRVVVLGKPGRGMILSAWADDAKKAPQVKTLLDGVAATVKNLE